MKKTYLVVAAAVVAVVVIGAVALSSIELTAPSKTVQKVIPNGRFPR